MSDSMEDFVLDMNFTPSEFDEALLEFEDENIIDDWFSPRTTITTAQRLERFPEMYHIPARRHKNLPSEALNSETTRFVKVYDPFRKSEALLDNILVACTECNSWFRSAIVMGTHRASHFNGKREIRPPSFICPYECCTARCDYQDTLNLHVKHHHDRADIDYEDMQFPSWEAFQLKLRPLFRFQAWKEDYEHTTASRFVHFSGRLTSYGKTFRMSCFFTRTSTSSATSSSSSTSISSENNRTRQSKKLERACTAHMAVREVFGKIHVRACLTHCGHEGMNHMYNLPLSRRIKSEIATALMKGHCETEILDSFRENCPASDRRYYVRPYEIRNVYRKLVQNQERQHTKVQVLKEIDEEIIFEDFSQEKQHHEEHQEIYAEYPPEEAKEQEEIPIIFDELLTPIVVKEEEVITDY